MNEEQIRNVVEAALMTAGRPLSLDDLLSVFGDGARPERGSVREVVQALGEEYEGRGIELVEVASGYRIQARKEFSDFLSRLWQERPQRYSRALMETLALIAYRQPITRGEIEDVRGVSVSTNIVRTLLDRNWVRVVGHRDVPGKPAMYGTTREFLDYFGLKKLDELPSLAELKDIDSINVELDLREPEERGGESEDDGARDDGPEAESTAAAEAPRDESDAPRGAGDAAPGEPGEDDDDRAPGGESRAAGDVDPAGEDGVGAGADEPADEQEPGEAAASAHVVHLPRG